MDLKIVSLNIWRGALIDDALKFLKQQNPDIIALQEVTNSPDPSLDREFRLYQILCDQLGYPYHSFAPMLINNTPEGKIPEGPAVLSRMPLQEASPVFFMPFRDDYVDIPENFATSSRCMQHVRLDTPSGKLDLYNIHGIWDLDGERYSAERQHMSKLICEEIQGKSRVLLMGDTNAQPANQALRNVEKYLNSVFGTSLASTFNMRRKTNPGYATAAVDMMFLSPGIQVITKDVPRVDISDHLPLVVTVRI